MITEDYVCFETAKLLKEKGFDEKCRALYTFWVDEVEGPKEDNAETWNVEPKYFSAPTLQMAMKWLREVHNVFIRILQSHIDSCQFEVYWNHGDYYRPNTFNNSYEQAAEEAIKYCLENLI